MANLFKRAALALGRWTGLKREPEVEVGLTLIEPVAGSADEFSDSINAGAAQSAVGGDLPSPDASANPWNDALEASDSMARRDTDAAIEAAIATGQFDEAPAQAFDAASIQPAELQPTELQPVVAAAAGVIAAEEPVVVEAVAAAATAAPAPVVEEVKPPIELKPEPVSAPISTPKPSVSFTQLYELISTEVNKRTDNAVTVYERLLSVTREELEATRRSNRIAWSVGGVMTAVAALGAVWAAGEVSASRVEVGSLKQQVMAGQQASLECDQLRSDLVKTREASARIEIDMLKSRLDQALTVTAERDRMKDELLSIRQAKQEAETELRIARAAAATQPVSQARPATDKPVARQAGSDAVAGAERPDVWSILLDGKDSR